MTTRLAAVTVCAAALALSCDGSPEGSTPAAPDVGVVTPSDETATVAASKNDTLICHVEEETGSRETLAVPGGAVNAHLAHGDTLGECPVCPCFTTDRILAAAATCSDTNLDAFCSKTSDPTTMFMVCSSDGGGTGPLGPLGMWTAASTSGTCIREDILSEPPLETLTLPITAEQLAGCHAAIQATNLCAV